MYRLYIDDYFSAEELNHFLVEYGYNLVSRDYTAVSTHIEVEDVEGDWDIQDVVALMRNELYVDVEIL
jgi:hypothetical protein